MRSRILAALFALPMSWAYAASQTVPPLVVVAVGDQRMMQVSEEQLDAFGMPKGAEVTLGPEGSGALEFLRYAFLNGARDPVLRVGIIDPDMDGRTDTAFAAAHLAACGAVVGAGVAAHQAYYPYLETLFLGIASYPVAEEEGVARQRYGSLFKVVDGVCVPVDRDTLPASFQATRTGAGVRYQNGDGPEQVLRRSGRSVSGTFRFEFDVPALEEGEAAQLAAELCSYFWPRVAHDASAEGVYFVFKTITRNFLIFRTSTSTHHLFEDPSTECF